MGKKADTSQEERQDRIHKLLSARSIVTAASLARIFKVSSKTVLRDIDEMNDLPGVGGKIRWVASEGSFRYTGPVTLLNRTFIAGEDMVTAFLIACSMMKDFTSMPLSDEMQRLSRILMGSKSNAYNPFMPNPEKYSFVHSRMARVDPKVWRVCTSALNACHKLDIVYQKINCEPEKRTILPLHLKGTKGGWYLVSHCELAEAQRTFYLSRILEAQDTGDSFSPANYKFDPNQYFRKKTDIFKTGAYLVCEVRLKGWAIARVKEMTFFDGQTVTDETGGSAIMRFETEDLFSAAAFVIEMAGDAKALKPKALVDKVKENVRALAKTHGVR